MMYSHVQRGIPDFPICGESGPRFPIPGIPGYRPNRESGIPCFPIPAKSGIGDSLPDSRRGIGDSLPDSRPNRESGERELGISGSGTVPLWGAHGHDEDCVHSAPQIPQGSTSFVGTCRVSFKGVGTCQKPQLRQVFKNPIIIKTPRPF